jgi:hypothetical protein
MSIASGNPEARTEIQWHQGGQRSHKTQALRTDGAAILLGSFEDDPQHVASQRVKRVRMRFQIMDRQRVMPARCASLRSPADGET